MRPDFNGYGTFPTEWKYIARKKTRYAIPKLIPDMAGAGMLLMMLTLVGYGVVSNSSDSIADSLAEQFQNTTPAISSPMISSPVFDSTRSLPETGKSVEESPVAAPSTPVLSTTPAPEKVTKPVTSVAKTVVPPVVKVISTPEPVRQRVRSVRHVAPVQIARTITIPKVHSDVVAIKKSSEPLGLLGGIGKSGGSRYNGDEGNTRDSRNTYRGSKDLARTDVDLPKGSPAISTPKMDKVDVMSLPGNQFEEHLTAKRDPREKGK